MKDILALSPDNYDWRPPVRVPSNTDQPRQESVSTIERVTIRAVRLATRAELLRDNGTLG
jgi:hypothetical protein